MSRDAERLLAEVLKLPAAERMELARKAFDSIRHEPLAPVTWPDLIASSVTVDESARAIEDGRP